MSFKQILNQNGEVLYDESFFDYDNQVEYFNLLNNKVSWKKDQIKIFGKEIPIPRYQAWYGDPGTHYKYSNLLLNPIPWVPCLNEIRKIISKACNEEFNACLVNLYETGQDYAAYHADNEKELGKNPTIASLSLGGERLFHLKNNHTKNLIKIVLSPGSLLLMKGELQHHWIHQLPKTKKIVSPRINLTFRKIIL
jgi:alkylated DNA repair dioxygenase AlkB